MRAGRFHMFGTTLGDWRGRSGVRLWKNQSLRVNTILRKRWLSVVVLFISMMSYLYRLREGPRLHSSQLLEREDWSMADSLDWRSSCAKRYPEWLPPRKSNGYLVVRCNGGPSQQWIAIGNAVVAARIMNATLVLPELDSGSLRHDKSGFPGIYDVDHFITSLKDDIRVVRSLPTVWVREDNKIMLKPFQLQPPLDASVIWYETTALEKLKEHGAVYLTPFSHHLAEELDNKEYQRLRCRVNYHSLRFTNDIRNLTSVIVERLRLEGPYVSIHLCFEVDCLANAGSLGIFDSMEQEVLENYRKEHTATKEPESNKRNLIRDRPLTPKEIGLFLQALGFDNATRIYLAAGEIFGGDKFLDPLRAVFPYLEMRLTVTNPEEFPLINAEDNGSLGPAVDYLVCLFSDVFVPSYAGPSEFANNLIGQRLYYGFRPTVQLDRKAFAPLFAALESGTLTLPDFETSVRRMMSRKSTGILHPRVPSESFYTNPWPECFCTNSGHNASHYCPVKPTSNLAFVDDQDDNYGNWNI